MGSCSRDRRVTIDVRFNRKGVKTLAEDKLYKAEYVGSGTFLISKPKRKKAKLRQCRI